MATDPVLRMLGLARRAGKLAYGDELVREACFDHKTRCVFIAGDAGANAAKKAAFYADKANVPCVTLPHGKLELGSAIGKAGCAMCAVADIGMAAAAVNKLGLSVISIYMGGGTPTTLTAQQLDRLCSRIAERFDLSALREYTVEAGRPDTITDDKLRTLRAHGVDRISVNPQTMSDEVLNVIGRRHTAADIVEALEKVRKVGGMEVNMDLIAGLPADSAEGFEKTLDTVIALDPENITVHTLSLKKGSRITLEGSAIPSDAEVGKMLDIAQDKLRRGGWAPYYLYRQKFMSGGFENVGWSKPGSENIYNVCIMEELCSIIALGGGGSTKLISPAGGRNIRFFAPKYPAEYISGIQKTCSDKQGIIDFYSKESKK